MLIVSHVSLILFLEVQDVKTPYRKACAPILLTGPISGLKVVLFFFTLTALCYFVALESA